MYLYRNLIVIVMVGVVHGEVLDQVRVVDASTLDALKLLLDGRHLQCTCTMYMFSSTYT